MATKWIQGMNMKKGALTAKAKRAGKSISEYCAGKGLDIITKKQCSLAKTLSKFKK